MSRHAIMVLLIFFVADLQMSCVGVGYLVIFILYVVATMTKNQQASVWLVLLVWSQLSAVAFLVEFWCLFFYPLFLDRVLKRTGESRIGFFFWRGTHS